MELSKVVRVWFLSFLPKNILVRTQCKVWPNTSRLSPAVAPTSRKGCCLTRPHLSVGLHVLPGGLLAVPLSRALWDTVVLALASCLRLDLC